MTKTRIALGVTKQSGKWILKYLYDRDDIEIIAADSAIDRPGQVDCSDEIDWLGIPRKSYKEIVELKPDLFINISYPKIIKKDLLDICPCINLHMGKLPDYRGRNVFAHAIQNGDDTYTVTLHMMTIGIDEGNIIAERTLPIYPSDTSKTLHDRAEIISYEMFKEELPNILSGQYQKKEQVGEINYYGKELNKEINLTNNPLDIYNKIRSLDFPPYEPAYCRVNGKKINLRMADISINNGKIVFRPDLFNQ